MPLSHGKTTTEEDYPSLAYFVKHKITSRQFLFFGDVEPDSVSGKGTSLAVWRQAAPLIAEGSLTAIFLECSWLTGQPDAQLYGHLTPPYFVEELQVLAKEVVAYREKYNSSVNNIELDAEGEPVPKRRRSLAGFAHPTASPLGGVKVYVIHCKEPMDGADDIRPISQITATEIKSLLKDSNLGAEIIGAEPGMRICE
jgi:hypothetical protein